MDSRKILISMVLLGLVFLATPVLAASVTYDFNTWPDRNLFFEQYNANNFHLDTSSGKARIWTDGTDYSGVKRGGIGTNFLLRGDFDVSVDWINNRQVFDNRQQLELHVEGQDFLFYNVRNVYDGSNDVHVWTGTGSGNLGSTPTTAIQGNLRITRVGTVMAAYFSPTRGAPADTPFYSAVTNGEDVHITFVIQNNDGQTGPLDASFDNFAIRADAFVGFASPPVPLLLLLSD